MQGRKEIIMNKKYYLAYGSNLNIGQMQYRCPNAKPIGRAAIDGYELLFKSSKTGAYATIEKCKGATVPVGVWEVDAADEKALDRYEGYPAFYYKKDMDVYLEKFDGTQQKVKAFVYIMHEERLIGIPTHTYVAVCLSGYDDFGFEPNIFLEAYRESNRRLGKSAT